MFDPANDPTRLNRRDLIAIGALVVFGAFCLILGLRLFPTVFPEATIRFDVDRSESRQLGETWLRSHDFDVSGYRYASAFQYDDTAKVFLERELGLAAMNDAVESTARIWKWSHRWFRPLQKEEFLVDIAPTGQLVRFVHLLPDSAAGASLVEVDARSLAEKFLGQLRGDGLANLHYLGATARRCDTRIDHRFTWERIDVDYNGGRYRHQVTIRGDRLGGYREFVKVPETWSRDYSKLRSKNTVAGSIASVFFILTFLAMIVIVFQQARRRQIRWRFADLMGAIGGLLVLLVGINGLPRALYRYNTTESFGGFLAESIVMLVLSAVGAAVLIIVIVASGEHQYRITYPNKLSLPRFFSWRGIRTKEFLFSALAGLVLTCFFVAYQAVFYRVASSLGAWSPAEVPYDDLLNSAFPAAFLLFIGFFPAVTEEFMSRAFSVPFFSRIFRSRIVAVLIASAIWAFGHSTYPNQPFYVRGLELLILGSLICVLMIRFNLVALLFWHYTVDAVYSGYLLLRSGNAYYVASAAIVGGILILPLIVAVVAYVRTQRFTDPGTLRHPVPPPEDEMTEVAAAPPIAFDPKPLTRNRTFLTIGATAAAVLIALLIANGLEDQRPRVSVRIDRNEAVKKAREFLGQQGIDTERFQKVVRFGDEIGATTARFIQSQEGLGRLGDVYPELLAAQAWRVRFFEPLEVEEVRVRVDASSGRVVGFEHRRAEAESLATPDEEAAERLAIGLLASAGLRPDRMDEKEAADEPRPKRVDRSYAWEATEGDRRNVSEARYRLEATIAGDRPAGLRERLRLPETYVRERGKRTILWGLALALVIGGAAAGLSIAIFNAVRSRKGGSVGWRKLVPIGGIGAVIAVVATMNAIPRVTYSYETSIPWSSFTILLIVGLVTAAVFYFFLAWAGTAFIQRLHPSIAALGDRESRAKMLPAALVALLIAPIWAWLLTQVDLFLAAWFPMVAPPPLISAPLSLETYVPAIGAMTTTLPRVFMLALVVGVVLHLVMSPNRPVRAIQLMILAALAVGMALLPARSLGEFLVELFRIVLIVGVAIPLARILFRDNPLAYLAAVYGIAATESVGGLIAQSDSWARGHGIVAGLILLLPILWVWFRSRWSGSEGYRRL